MAAIENDRDIILQATSPRVIPVLIPIGGVEGLPGRLDDIDSDISTLGTEVNSLMGNTQDLSIRVSSLTVDNSTSTTLTVVRKNGISGTVSWTVFAGVATLSGTGDSRTIAGNSISGSSVTVKAAIGSKEVFATINKVGALASQNTVNLSSQVTGQLSSGSVSGLGALALLNTVNLSTQTTGALNGQTQVTNLGTLAYANAIAANQIGAGTLAAGVIYAGEINADNITSGTITGRSIRTKASGARLQISATGPDSDRLIVYNSNGGANVIIGNESFFMLSSQTHPIDVTAYGSSSGCRFRGNTGAGLIAGSTSGPAMRLEKTTTLPTPVEGGVCYHSTHQFIFSNGSKWFKPTWTQV